MTHPIIATHADGRKFRLGEHPRRTRFGLFKALRRNREMVRALCDGIWDAPTFHTKQGWRMGPVRVHYERRSPTP